VTSALNSSPLLSSFKASFSSSIMRMEYILLVLHLCPGTNFSLHQKHKPLALHSPSSLFIMALVGLVLVLMRKLYGGGITIIFRGVFWLFVKEDRFLWKVWGELIFGWLCGLVGMIGCLVPPKGMYVVKVINL